MRGRTSRSAVVAAGAILIGSLLLIGCDSTVQRRGAASEDGAGGAPVEEDRPAFRPDPCRQYATPEECSQAPIYCENLYVGDCISWTWEGCFGSDSACGEGHVPEHVCGTKQTCTLHRLVNSVGHSECDTSKRHLCLPLPDP